MNLDNQKWYDKPVTKIILITISLTWMIPYVGFVLSSFRNEQAVKRYAWWNSISSGTILEELTFANYTEILFAENLSRSFFNSFAVTIPSTIIPITIAAFAAYAFAFIDFRGKDIAFLFVVAMMIVPLQMSLIPLLKLMKSGAILFGIPLVPELNINGTFVAVWFAHTGFGLPLATFQFLWVYNDFLVANVFLGINPRNMVVTSHVAQLTVGNYGEAWHLRTSGAVISMIVPLIVFFSLQRFFIRGLIGGAVKG